MQTLQKPPKPECSKKNFRRDILTAESQSATWQASVRDLSLIHIFLLEGGGFYGTQWDDEAISPLALRLPGEGTEADRGQDGVVSEREEPDEGVQGRTSGDRKAGEREPGIGESERRERNDRESAEIEWNDRESTEKEWSDGETAEREWGDGKEKERGESGREMQEKELENYCRKRICPICIFKGQEPCIMRKIKYGTATVSYTHLDVYKRQT